jgi:transposase
MRVRSDVTIRFALEPVDFRKSIDGLAISVGQALGRDPMGGEVFVFRNRTRTALKAIYWTSTGFVLVYKRLERGQLELPSGPGDTGEVLLAPELLQSLLDGVPRTVEPKRS